MGFTYHHLDDDDDDVRTAMKERWSEEWIGLANWPPGSCYGKQLNAAGREASARAMPAALGEHDDEWLRARMSELDHRDTHLLRKTKNGGALVDYNKEDAARKLCLGEFDIAYVRGVATALLLRGESECEACRADGAYEPRGECSDWEGQAFSLQSVIDGHRARYWPPGECDPRAFSLPSGPNCHHSIRSLNR